MQNLEASKPPRSLYIHVPFCRARCHYCSFYRLPYDAALMEGYVQGMERAIAGLPKGPALETLYLGGGTPSLLKPSELARILESIHKRLGLAEGAEITLEGNPESLDQAKLLAYRRLGINRLSMGVQSSEAKQLQSLGRLHRFEAVQRLVGEARASGFENLSLDLIFGLPGQSMEALEHELDAFLALDPDHLSFYGLQLEEETPLGRVLLKRPELLPDEALERAMYRRIRERLEAAGLFPYELSNAAKAGKQGRHNLVYWTGRSYHGLGPGAASYVGGVRRHQVADLDAWLQAYAAGDLPERSDELISGEEAAREAMILGLRLDAGVAFQDFEQAFGVELRQHFREEIKAAGALLEADDRSLRLTEKGRDLANQVFCLFLS